jgi:hypothetical protein
MRAKKVNEGIEDLFSDSNLKAIRSWSEKESENQHEISILEPKTIIIDQEKDYFSLKFLLQKYHVKFTERNLSDN